MSCSALLVLGVSVKSILKPFFFRARIEGTKGHFARGGFRGGGRLTMHRPAIARMRPIMGTCWRTDLAARGGFRGGVGLPGDHLGLSPTARLPGRRRVSAPLASR